MERTNPACSTVGVVCRQHATGQWGSAYRSDTNGNQPSGAVPVSPVHHRLSPWRALHTRGPRGNRGSRGSSATSTSGGGSSAAALGEGTGPRSVQPMSSSVCRPAASQHVIPGDLAKEKTPISTTTTKKNISYASKGATASNLQGRGRDDGAAQWHGTQVSRSKRYFFGVGLVKGGTGTTVLNPQPEVACNLSRARELAPSPLSTPTPQMSGGSTCNISRDQCEHTLQNTITTYNHSCTNITPHTPHTVNNL